MGIDEHEAAAAVVVLKGHIPQEGGFADAGLADQINMRQAIGLLDAETCMLPAKGSLPKIRDIRHSAIEQRPIATRTARFSPYDCSDPPIPYCTCDTRQPDAQRSMLNSKATGRGPRGHRCGGIPQHSWSGMRYTPVPGNSYGRLAVIGTFT
jgi:hypothetical protein